jgi:hypothetical protein
LQENASNFFYLNLSQATNVTISTCNLFTSFDTTIQVGGNFPGGFNNDAVNCVAGGVASGKQSVVMLTNILPGYNFTINGSQSNDSGLYGVSIDCDGLNPRVFNPNASSDVPSVAPYPFYSNYTVIDCANVTYGNQSTLGGANSAVASSGSSSSSWSSSWSGNMGPPSSTGNGADSLSSSPFTSLMLGAILFVVAC